MRPRRSLAVVVAAAAVLLIVPVIASADETPGGGTVLEQCLAHQSDPPALGALACRTAKQFAAGTAATCRTPLAEAPDPSTADACAAIDGRAVSEGRVAAYIDSWVHEALTLQRGLDDAAPLVEEQLSHTHNSFNASAYRVPADPSRPGYYPTLTNQDPNQVYSLTDQLRMDVRAIEVDLHWVPSPFGSQATNGFWVTMCHGNSQDQLGKQATVHVGCSDDRPLQDGLQELATWLKANPHEVILLYLENQMNDDPLAHKTAGDLIGQYLGSLVLPTPAAQDCAPMPLAMSRAQIRAGGHQVLIVGNCGAGAGTSWGRAVHERGPKWDEHGDPDGYGPQQCAEDRAARKADSSFRRYFEDSTWVAATAGSNPVTSSLGGTSTITTEATSAMVRCGANIIGLDQLTPDDPRLAALVWSWATDEPRVGGGDCAYQGADARFHSDGCRGRRRFACVDATNEWHVSMRAGRPDAGARTCAIQGMRFAVPVNGFRNQLLVEAKSAASVSEVWLNYQKTGATWTPTSRSR